MKNTNSFEAFEITRTSGSLYTGILKEPEPVTRWKIQRTCPTLLHSRTAAAPLVSGRWPFWRVRITRSDPVSRNWTWIVCNSWNQVWNWTRSFDLFKALEQKPHPKRNWVLGFFQNQIWNFGKRIRAWTGANLQLTASFGPRTGLERGLIFRTKTGDFVLFFWRIGLETGILFYKNPTQNSSNFVVRTRTRSQIMEGSVLKSLSYVKQSWDIFTFKKQWHAGWYVPLVRRSQHSLAGTFHRRRSGLLKTFLQAENTKDKSRQWFTNLEGCLQICYFTFAL